MLLELQGNKSNGIAGTERESGKGKGKESEKEKGSGSENVRERTRRKQNVRCRGKERKRKKQRKERNKIAEHVWRKQHIRYRCDVMVLLASSFYITTGNCLQKTSKKCCRKGTKNFRNSCTVLYKAYGRDLDIMEIVASGWKPLFEII